MIKPTEYRFDNALACADALAQRVGASMQEAIKACGSASLIVSGGKTPLSFFERLHEFSLDWPSVNMGLADERWVDVGHPDSNEGFVRRHLLCGRARSANLIGLKNDAPSAQDGAALAWARLAPLHRPFDAVLLGMGDDGHTASLFPASPDLQRALDDTAQRACIAMTAPSAPRERLSLNLAALLDSRLIVLLITGEDKWKVYERARDANPLHMPVNTVLKQTKTPVEVYWSA